MADPVQEIPAEILVVGEKGSGKRTAQAALLLQLTKGAGSRWHLGNERDRREVSYYRTKFERCGEPLPPNHPFQSVPLYGLWRGEEMALTLAVVPPELLLDPEQRGVRRQRLSTAAGVLFLVDPGRYLDGRRSRRAMAGDNLLLHCLIQEFRIAQGSVPLPVPLAFLYTKADQYSTGHLEALQAEPPLPLRELHLRRELYFPASSVGQCSAFFPCRRGSFPQFRPFGLVEAWDWILARTVRQGSRPEGREPGPGGFWGRYLWVRFSREKGGRCHG